MPPIYLADSFGDYMAPRACSSQAQRGSGEGQVIDLPLLGRFPRAWPGGTSAHGQVKPRTGSRSTNSGPRNAYKTKDGRYVCLSASTQKMAERVFTSIGRADLIGNPRYRTNADRVVNAAELDSIIGEFIAQRTQAENVAFFEKAEVTIGPIYDITQILEDPHFIEREVIADYPDADMGEYPMHHVVPRLSATPGAIRTPAPALGQHNREILATAGVSDEQYRKLVADGAVVEGAAAAKDTPAEE